MIGAVTHAADVCRTKRFWCAYCMSCMDSGSGGPKDLGEWETKAEAVAAANRHIELTRRLPDGATALDAALDREAFRRTVRQVLRGDIDPEATSELITKVAEEYATFGAARTAT